MTLEIKMLAWNRHKNEAGLNRLMENEIEQHEPYKTWRATQVVQKIKEVLIHYRHPTVV